MSYSLQVWSVNRAALPEQLPDPNQWKSSSEFWVRDGRSWQLSIGQSDSVQPEDFPDGIGSALPGIAYLTELNLSPITEEGRGRELLLRIASVIAKATHGVVFDPQADTITTAKGVKRLTPLGSSQSATLVSLSWWFDSGPLVERDTSGLISVLESFLPDALPRRYGLYEPPQHIYEETGRKHFAEFLRDNSGIVWYPHAPVEGVYLSIPPRIGGSRLGFRVGRLSINVDADALTQPGWELGIQRAWRELSQFIRPFYGDVRFERGYDRSRGRYWITSGTQRHPVCSWWWAGIPEPPVLAAVLGTPYRELWPTFYQCAETAGALSFVSSDDWRVGSDALTSIGRPPLDIAQSASESSGINRDRTYPTNWPFEPPCSEN